MAHRVRSWRASCQPRNTVCAVRRAASATLHCVPLGSVRHKTSGSTLHVHRGCSGCCTATTWTALSWKQSVSSLCRSFLAFARSCTSWCFIKLVTTLLLTWTLHALQITGAPWCLPFHACVLVGNWLWTMRAFKNIPRRRESAPELQGSRMGCFLCQL